MDGKSYCSLLWVDGGYKIIENSNDGGSMKMDKLIEKFLSEKTTAQNGGASQEL